MSLAQRHVAQSDFQPRPLDVLGIAPVLEEVPPIGERDADLLQRFEPSRLRALSEQFLRNGTGQDLLEMAAQGGRKFIVAPIPGDSEFSDIATSVETTTFAKRFKRSLTAVYEEYEKTAENSTLLALFYIGEDGPEPAGALRVIEPSAVGDLSVQKSIIDLVADVDVKENPWINEIKENYFAPGEIYDPVVAWTRLCDAKNIILDPAESHDIATIAVDDKFASDGAMDGPSLYLYHSCLRYALGNGIKNLVSIQDLKPYSILQSFGNPFDEFEALKPHPYGGPFDTIPAFCVLKTGMQNIRDNNEGIGSVFIDGLGLGGSAVLLEETDPVKYSNQTLGLE